MTTPSHVVIGYDFTASANPALHRAIALAARAPFHVLHFVCVLEPHSPLARAGEPVDFQLATRIQRELHDAIVGELALAEIATDIHFFVHVRLGRAASEVLATARDVGADLIIVGSHGVRRPLGSVAERIARDAGCTVEVARPRTYEPVALMHMVEVRPHDAYVPPHRYSYESRQAVLRPADWPLY